MYHRGICTLHTRCNVILQRRSIYCEGLREGAFLLPPGIWVVLGVEVDKWSGLFFKILICRLIMHATCPYVVVGGWTYVREDGDANGPFAPRSRSVGRTVGRRERGSGGRTIDRF